MSTTIKALKAFSSTTLGNVEGGEVKTGINPGYARHLVEHGYVEIVENKAGYKTKVETDKPAPLDSGRAKPSGASRQGRRSKKQTSSESGEDGQSSSTPVSD